MNFQELEILKYYSEPLKRRMVTLLEGEECTYTCNETVNIRINDPSNPIQIVRKQFRCPLQAENYGRYCFRVIVLEDCRQSVLRDFCRYFGEEALFDVLL